MLAFSAKNKELLGASLQAAAPELFGLEKKPSKLAGML